MALQLRIANLIAIAQHPMPLGIARSDVIRDRAMHEALRLLGLTADE
jgi:hypothetical protein